MKFSAPKPFKYLSVSLPKYSLSNLSRYWLTNREWYLANWSGNSAEMFCLSTKSLPCWLRQNHLGMREAYMISPLFAGSREVSRITSDALHCQCHSLLVILFNKLFDLVAYFLRFSRMIWLLFSAKWMYSP